MHPSAHSARPSAPAWAAAGVLLVAAVGLMGTPAWAETAVAVVDVQRAVMQTEDGLRAQATLKKLFDRRQQDLDRKQKQLEQDREDIEKQARVLSRAALQRRMEDWQRSMVELQTVFVRYNKELQQKQSELTAPILKKMLRIIRRIATRRSIDLVVDKQAVPYARADLDLSDMVVQMYNSGSEPEGEDATSAPSPSGAEPAAKQK
ncbi:MAG: OmpH family outer membrane protein [Deltaproteobacteria bacterium]|nr:OmpH family outer membrane protein [Deltaproteobacteria bacterium]